MNLSLQSAKNSREDSRVLHSGSRKSLLTRMWKSRYYYLMILPALVFIIVICYIPMYGLIIAFENFKVSLGYLGSPWVGLRNFVDFFHSYSLPQLLENTFILSFYGLFVGFPFPILVALILNEVKGPFKRITQTVLYAPHFISTVVLISMMTIMFSPSVGIVNKALNALGHESIYFLAESSHFRHLYVWSGVWQGSGWAAIIYLAALSGVDLSLLEAADLDRASRIQKIVHINVPTILPTIIIMLILNMGSIASVGYEKVYLMQNAMNTEVSEVISTYVYKRGIVNADYSFSTSIGLFNNVVNVTMLLIANKISSKVSETSLF